MANECILSLSSFCRDSERSRKLPECTQLSIVSVGKGTSVGGSRVDFPTTLVCLSLGCHARGHQCEAECPQGDVFSSPSWPSIPLLLVLHWKTRFKRTRLRAHFITQIAHFWGSPSTACTHSCPTPSWAALEAAGWPQWDQWGWGECKSSPSLSCLSCSLNSKGLNFFDIWFPHLSKRNNNSFPFSGN